jgi:hypothetical protein
VPGELYGTVIDMVLLLENRGATNQGQRCDHSPATAGPHSHFLMTRSGL